MSKVTLQDVTKVVEGLLVEYGEDYVYGAGGEDTGCQYASTEGAPSCLVGHVLYALAPDVFEAVRVYEEKCGVSMVFLEIGDVVELPLPMSEVFEKDVLLYLDEVQSKQDDKKTWGYAHECGLAAVEGVL